jgi:hypothetical protein
MMKLKKMMILQLLLLSQTVVFCQTNLTQTQQGSIIDSLYSRLEGFYINKNQIPDIRKAIDKSFQKGEYKKITQPAEFASKLSEDLKKVTHDLHFSIDYDPQWIEDKLNSEKESQKEILREKEIAAAEKENFGFNQLKILEGNIGYLDLRTFHDPAYASETAAAAMQFFSHVDALIIDLRNNNGGAMEMAQFISSYLFSQKELPLFKYYYFGEANKKTEREMWLLPSVPGKRLDKIDIYILTSGVSFSCAEWMSYSLQNLKRATIIGEQTAGGAHPVDRKILANGFTINIPFGEVKDPITNKDFEGVGVTPDIQISANEAVEKAHYLALEKCSRNNPNALINYAWLLPIVKNRQQPIVLDQAILESFVGNFGKTSLVLKNNNLYYSWNKKLNFLLTPITDDIFILDGVLDFRIQLITENGKVTGMKRIYEDGQEGFNEKNQD